MSSRRIGAFRIGEQLGAGGAGTVYSARHLETGRDVALKVLQDLDDEERLRFGREVQAQAKLEHPGVVQLLDYGEISPETAEAHRDFESGQLYVAMELASRGSLRQEMPLSAWPELRNLLEDLFRTLAYAHAREVVHRDLKPENLLVFGEFGPAAEDYRVKVADFGLAHTVEWTRETDEENLDKHAGTPVYAPPEQLRGEWRDFGPWTDLDAVGCMVWELVCGEPPFGRHASRAALQHLDADRPALEPAFDVPSGLESWTHRMMAIEPEDRFQHARDALEALPGTGEADGDGDEDVPVERMDAVGSSREPIAGAGLELLGLREIPFVDRTASVGALWDELLEVRDRAAPSFAVVAGEMGVGKTRLVEEVGRWADELGVAKFYRTGYSADGERPSEGLSGLVRRIARGWDMERAEFHDRVGDLLERWTPGPGYRGDDARALTELVHPSDREDGDDALRYRFSSPSAIYALMGRLFRHLTWQRPGLVLFDDLHWGMEAVGCLEHLFGERAADLPVLFVGTVDRERLGRAPAPEGWVRELLDDVGGPLVELDRLGPEDQREMIGRMVRLEPELEELLVKRTEGNPLFAAQSLAHWAREEALELGEHGYRWAGESFEPPEGIRALWRERIEQFVGGFEGREADAAWRALGLAAVLGREVDRREWGEACREDGFEPPAGFEALLVDWGLALRSNEGWRFAHRLLVETLEHFVRDAGRWASYHAVCAQALDRMYEETFGAAALRRGMHWMEAGDRERAFEALTEAAGWQWRRGAYRRWGETLDRQADILEELDWSEADRRRLDHRLERARWEFYAGELEEAERLAREVAETARQSPEDLQRLGSSASEIVGYCRLRTDAPGEAEDWARNAIQLAVESGDRKRHGNALSFLGRLEETRLRLGRAIEEYEQALEKLAEAEDADMPRLEVRGRWAEAVINTGDLERAEREIEAILEEADERGFRRQEATGWSSLGDIAFLRGDYRRAEECWREFGSICDELGDRDGTAIAQTLFAIGAVAREAFDAAREALEQSRAIYEAIGREPLGVMDELVELGIAAGRTNWEAFDRRFEPLRTGWPAGQRTHRIEPALLEIVGDFADGAGKDGRARSCWELARDLMRRIGDDDAVERIESRCASSGE